MSADTAVSRHAASRVPLFGPVFVIVLHLVALAILPANPSLALVGALEAGSLLICALSFAGTRSALRTTVVCWAFALGLFGAVEAARLGTDSLWLVALTLVIAGLLAGYGLHRYERVRLGLVSDEV